MLSCKRPGTMLQGVVNSMLIGGILERRFLIFVSRNDTEVVALNGFCQVTAPPEFGLLTILIVDGRLDSNSASSPYQPRNPCPNSRN